MIDPANPYTLMQKAFYVGEASRWSPESRDFVVGSFDAHNAHADYDLLFTGISEYKKIALDFGCGPGRMIARYRNRFWRIDGADISLENLVHAKRWAVSHNAPEPSLFLSNGVDLSEVPSGVYDVVFSTICLQHIPVHAIRLNLFREFHRVLAPGGWFTAQMGYGATDDPRGRDYYANDYDAGHTNGLCDAVVTHWHQLMGDCDAAGFLNFSSNVRPTGPSDWHPNWIFFRAQKAGGS